MRKGNKSVFAILEKGSDADRAVDQLKSAGFRNDDISVLMPSLQDSRDYAYRTSTKAPEGIAAGVTGGTLLGGGLGWLVGIGSLAIPGIGPFLAAGPVVGALAGAGVGGAVGGIAGALIGLGIPEYEARRYEGILKGGGILLAVHVDDAEWSRKAKIILEEAGGRDIHTAGEIATGMVNPGFRTASPPISDADYDDFIYRK